MEVLINIILKIMINIIKKQTHFITNITQKAKHISSPTSPNSKTHFITIIT